MARKSGVRYPHWRLHYAGAARGYRKALLAGMVVAALFWIALAYLHPDLRRAIIFSGFGLC